MALHDFGEINEAEIRACYGKLTKLLIEKSWSITTMESATGGQIASLITDTKGSSAIFKGSFVTYSNEAKLMCGVLKETIDRYTVYSKETACEMAKACADAYSADIGIGITGTMGNIDPANKDASLPGHVYFAFCIKGVIKSFYIELEPQPDRLTYKMAVCKAVYDELIKEIHALENKEEKSHEG